MKSLLTSSLALVAIGATAQAAVDPTPESTESEWARLDREIGDLAASIRRPASGTNVGGLVRTYFARSNDSDAAFNLNATGTSQSVNSGNQVGGFHMKDVDLWAEGSVAEYDWRINIDYFDSSIVLEDAYVRWNCQSGVNVVFGQFKAPILRSNTVYPENQVLPDRTFLGQIFDVWDTGVMVTGDWKSLGAFLSVQNGFDGAVEELLVAGRAEYRLFGGTGRVEGAFGAGDDTRATVGAMWLKDSSNQVEGNAFGGDVNVTSGPFALHGEIAHVEGSLLANAATGATRIGGNNYLGQAFVPINFAEQSGAAFVVDDATIWSGTASFMVEAIDTEFVVRFESLDDPGNTRLATVGANWHHSGKNAVWHLGVTQVSSNNPQASPSAGNLPNEGVGDATLLQAGLSLGMSTSNI